MNVDRTPATAALIAAKRHSASETAPTSCADPASDAHVAVPLHASPYMPVPSKGGCSAALVAREHGGVSESGTITVAHDERAQQHNT